MASVLEESLQSWRTSAEIGNHTMWNHLPECPQTSANTFRIGKKQSVGSGYSTQLGLSSVKRTEQSNWSHVFLPNCQTSMFRKCRYTASIPATHRTIRLLRRNRGSCGKNCRATPATALLCNSTSVGVRRTPFPMKKVLSLHHVQPLSSTIPANVDIVRCQPPSDGRTPKANRQTTDPKKEIARANCHGF